MSAAAALTPRRVVAATADRFGFEPADLVGPSQFRPVVAARHTAMFLCRELCGLSLHQIGRRFGRTHPAVLYGVRRVDADVAADVGCARPAAEVARALSAARPAGHPLAAAASRRCRRSHEVWRLFGVACGACWVAAVEADERLAAEFGLSAEPPPADPDYVDPVAVELAAAGDPVRLYRGERAELARRAYAGTVPWRVASARVSGSVAARAAAAGRAVA